MTAKKKSATSNAAKKAAAKKSPAKKKATAPVEPEEPEEEEPEEGAENETPENEESEEGAEGQGSEGEGEGDGEEEGEPELPEADVNTYVDEINELISSSASTEVKSTWRVGQLLVELRDKCPEGQYARICGERIMGSTGKPMSRSWCQKASKLFSTFEEDEETATKIGLKRFDTLSKLPLELMQEWIKDGIVCSVPDPETGEEVDQTQMVWEFTSGELKDAVHEALVQLGMIKNPTPQEKCVEDLQKIAKAMNKFKEVHANTLKTKFARQHIEVLEGCMVTINSFSDGIEFQVRKSTKKGSGKSA